MSSLCYASRHPFCTCLCVCSACEVCTLTSVLAVTALEGLPHSHKHFPDESWCLSRADVAVLEEPEHLNWYQPRGGAGRTSSSTVVGIIHTNYLDYAQRGGGRRRQGRAPCSSPTRSSAASTATRCPCTPQPFT